MNKIFTLLAAGLLLAGAANLVQASGFATYFARVTESGGVQRSSGVADVENPAAGIYDVTFTRDVNYCGWMAGLAGTTNPGAGYATVTRAAATVLRIRTHNSNGTLVNRAFTVMVQCTCDSAAPGGC